MECICGKPVSDPSNASYVVDGTAVCSEKCYVTQKLSSTDYRTMTVMFTKNYGYTDEKAIDLWWHDFVETGHLPFWMEE